MSRRWRNKFPKHKKWTLKQKKIWKKNRFIHLIFMKQRKENKQSTKHKHSKRLKQKLFRHHSSYWCPMGTNCTSMEPRPTSRRWSSSPCIPTTWNPLSNPSRWICSSKASWHANRAHEARRAFKCFVHDFPHSGDNSNLYLSLNNRSTIRTRKFWLELWSEAFGHREDFHIQQLFLAQLILHFAFSDIGLRYRPLRFPHTLPSYPLLLAM